MRVVNSSIYRNYTNSMNSVQLRLNKSINKVSSGREYEAAADSPLSYYRGKEIDSQYQEVLSKKNLLTDVKKRLEQQEVGISDTIIFKLPSLAAFSSKRSCNTEILGALTRIVSPFTNLAVTVAKSFASELLCT